MDDSVKHQLDLPERERFWNLAYEQLARLKSDPVAWHEYQDEIAAFDALAGDGLEDEEPSYTPEEVEEIVANAGLARKLSS